MRRGLQRFARSSAGATAVEYGLIAALLAVIAIAGMMTAGNSLRGLFDRTANTASTTWDNVNMG